jgi:hypothetical protein
MFQLHPSDQDYEADIYNINFIRQGAFGRLCQPDVTDDFAKTAIISSTAALHTCIHKRNSTHLKFKERSAQRSC